MTQFAIDELDPEFRKQFIEDFRHMVEDRNMVDLVTTRERAWCLLAAIQLASRHPEAMETHAMKVAVEMALHLQRLIATTPALKQVAEMGWDQTKDVPWHE